MTTLHIEHAISDFATWKAAFDRFAPARERGGVRGHRVHQPVDDPAWVVIDLDFARPDEAQAFLDVLRTSVWSSPDASPALVGAPRTQVLQLALSG